jgi:hypothetical protein
VVYWWGSSPSSQSLLLLICFISPPRRVIHPLHSTSRLDYLFVASSNKLVNIFSAYTNSKRIFARGDGNSDLDCVHGIRFLSTCYVVIGHRYLMLMFFPSINSLKIMDVSESDSKSVKFSQEFFLSGYCIIEVRQLQGARFVWIHFS